MRLETLIAAGDVPASPMRFERREKRDKEGATMKEPVWMSTSELIWWARHGGSYAEHISREATVRRILTARHDEGYAVRMVNLLCGGPVTDEGVKV